MLIVKQGGRSLKVEGKYTYSNVLWLDFLFQDESCSPRWFIDVPFDGCKDIRSQHLLMCKQVEHLYEQPTTQETLHQVESIVVLSMLRYIHTTEPEVLQILAENLRDKVLQDQA